MFPEEDEGPIGEAGIYTWFLDSDKLFGDTLIAALFGLDPADTIKGLRFERYADRMHPEDRERVKGLISQAVLDGQPYHAEYRVLDAFDQVQHVIALGRCFYDDNGMPFIYSGIIYPIERLAS